jgi:phenylpropionate dioxygenase-like ring-hydroxylating dioxygenase large terminal subunit
MSRQQLIDMAKQVLEHSRAGTQSQTDEVVRIPAKNYYDPERFQLEVDRIFKRVPLMLGFSSELREPGSYRADVVAGVPVLLSRGQDGAMRAFVNTCSHRGAQLTEPGTGHVDRFSCPYHGWVYNTQGDYVGMPDAKDFGPVDKACMGLTALPVTERAGLIWAVLNPNATVDFDAFFQGYDELLEHLGFDSCYVVGRQTLVGANWKVAYDGYLDFYHLPILHAKSFGPDMSSKAIYNSWGPHQRVTGPGRYFDTLVDIPEDEWDDSKLTAGVWTIFPHISVAAFDAGGKVYMVSQLFPGDTPDESITVQHFLHTLPPDEEQAKLVADRMAFLKMVVADEDYITGRRIQESMKTGAKPEVLFGRNEGGGQRFHLWVQAILDADTDEQLTQVFNEGIGVRA